MKKLFLRLYLRPILLLVSISLAGCSSQDVQHTGDQRDFSGEALKENNLLQFFVGRHPDQTILKYAQADLDNDGKEDLIVIYRIGREKNEMSVIHSHNGSIEETNAVPAPVSDQLIQFRNIDEKPPLEFILQGRKGAKVGYAIFRIEDGKLTDLFGEGMEDCC